jgi:hypothetical protein
LVQKPGPQCFSPGVSAKISFGKFQKKNFLLVLKLELSSIPFPSTLKYTFLISSLFCSVWEPDLFVGIYHIFTRPSA